MTDYTLQTGPAAPEHSQALHALAEGAECSSQSKSPLIARGLRSGRAVGVLNGSVSRVVAAGLFCHLLKLSPYFFSSFFCLGYTSVRIFSFTAN